MTSDVRKNWPPAISDSLQHEMQKTPHGCGGCCHNDWIATEGRWVVGTCRQGIKLTATQSKGENESFALGGYDPAFFCTAQNAGMEM